MLIIINTTTRLACRGKRRHCPKGWKLTSQRSLLNHNTHYNVWNNKISFWMSRNAPSKKRLRKPELLSFPFVSRTWGNLKIHQSRGVFVMERTIHVTVSYHCVKFPAWIRKLPDIAETPNRWKSQKIVESSLSV